MGKELQEEIICISQDFENIIVAEQKTRKKHVSISRRRRDLCADETDRHADRQEDDQAEEEEDPSFVLDKRNRRGKDDELNDILQGIRW